MAAMTMTRMKAGIVPLVALVLWAHPARADETLESRLTPLIQGHKGKVAVAVKNLTTGESFAYHAGEPMVTASLIKFPIMVEAYRQAADKVVDLDKLITLKKADKVPGSGILTAHFSEGASFPLRDAIHLMIVYSDNTATNLVLEEIGIASTAQTMEKLGYPNTKAHSKVFRRDTSAFPERSKQFGIGSTTADEMVRLSEALYKQELVSPEASAAMLKHLEACDDKDKFPPLPAPRHEDRLQDRQPRRRQDGRRDHHHGRRAGRGLRPDRWQRGQAVGGRQRRQPPLRRRRQGRLRPLPGQGVGAQTGGRTRGEALIVRPPRIDGLRGGDPMGFFDALRRTLGGDSPVKQSPRDIEARFLGVDPDSLPLTPETPFESGAYDRAQWAKKLKRVLAELPGSQPEWEDVAAEARAMDFDPAWVTQCGLDEFALLVRRTVADRVVTEAEHRKLDLARDLIGIPDAEAETILHAIVAEAETFFGGTIEGA